MAIHVRADDVHLLGVGRADLRAKNFLSFARRIPLGVDSPQRGVGLEQRVGVDAGSRSRTFDHVAGSIVADAVDSFAGRVGASASATASSAARGTPLTGDTVHTVGRVVSQLAARVLVDDPLGVGAAVALELRLDPRDRVTVALRSLAPIAELRQAADRRLVLL